MGDDTTAAATEMKVDPVRAAALAANLSAVKARLAAAAGGRHVRLVAVSKLKPANDILALHQPSGGPGAPLAEGQVLFGENYAQELRDKAALLPRSIKWHFIGGLQTGHCKNLARIPNLWCVSSVDSLKKAKLLDAARGPLISAGDGDGDGDGTAASAGRLHVHVQVNTSGEESKSGCSPGAETVALCKAIVEECPSLRLLGLMTIGAIARSRAVAAAAAETGETGEAGETAENPDFAALRAQRDLVRRALGLTSTAAAADEPALELSMGMSDDFESAVASGSGEVRVGSTIFGQRPAKADAKLAV